MQASFLEWTFLQRVAVRLAHAYVGVRDASLADRHTKEVDTSERSMPKSKVDRSNIIASRYEKGGALNDRRETSWRSLPGAG